MGPGDDQLSSLMESYIDSRKPANDKFKRQLTMAEAEVRCRLLSQIRGAKYSSETCVIRGAYIHDMEGLASMLEGLDPSQRYEVTRLTNRLGNTCMHLAVYDRHSYDTGYTEMEILDYILQGLSIDDRFNLLKVQNSHGNTVLHSAGELKKSSLMVHLLSPLPINQQQELLSIKNTRKESVDMLPVPATLSTLVELQEAQKKVKVQKKEMSELKIKFEEITRACRQHEQELKDTQESVLRQNMELMNQQRCIANHKQDTQRLQQNVQRMDSKATQMLDQHTYTMQEMVDKLQRLEVYLRTAADTNETGDQEHND
ncbi:uncharacterized protein [Watersipora subatra]|uniref:uncharacterized protein n=1 Tax=Watersipora subatra TaxID=2589382 RepID=UPI00355B9B0B